MVRSVVVAGLAVAWIISCWQVGWFLGSQTKTAAASPAPAMTVPEPSALSSPRPSATPASTSPRPSLAPGPDTSAEPVVVLSGAGAQRSRTFDVVIGWQIVWQVDGDHLAISVNGDRDLGTVVDVPGPASGVTSPPVDGRYQLVIAADGPWTVTVIQGTG